MILSNKKKIITMINLSSCLKSLRFKSTILLLKFDLATKKNRSKIERF